MTVASALDIAPRLKILWLSHLIPYPPKSGVLMRSYHLIHELAKHHDVDLFAFNQSRLFRSHFPDTQIGLATIRDHFRDFIDRFHIEQIPSESRSLGRQMLALGSLIRPDTYTINWLKSRPARKALAQWLRDKNYDLIHFDTISLAPYLPADARCPVAMDHHNIESHMMLRRASHETKALKKWYFSQEGKRLRKYERKTLRRFDAHIVCSVDDQQRLLDLDRSLTVKVVPNGILVKPERPPRNPHYQPPKLLFIGGLDWYPNTDAVHFFLDDIWQLIAREMPLVEIDIIGKNPTEKMRDHAARDKRVHLHGFVDNIARYYEEAAVYVCPIRDGGGTKLKVLDALAHRVPLVGFPAACEGLALENNVHVGIALKPTEFAEKTLSLIKSPAKSQELGDAGYGVVKNEFDVGMIGVELAKFYSGIRANYKNRT